MKKLAITLATVALTVGVIYASSFKPNQTNTQNPQTTSEAISTKASSDKDNGFKCNKCNGTGWDGPFKCHMCGGDGETGN